MKPYPQLLSAEEQQKMLARAEELWRRLQENKLGGFSGINRPFWIVGEFKAVVEEFGRRDVGQHWTKDQRVAAMMARCTEIADKVVPASVTVAGQAVGRTGYIAHEWQAAWDGACVALGGDPEDYRR